MNANEKRTLWKRAFRVLTSARNMCNNKVLQKLAEYYAAHPSCSKDRIYADVIHRWEIYIIKFARHTLCKKFTKEYADLSYEAFLDVCNAHRSAFPRFSEPDRMEFLLAENKEEHAEEEEEENVQFGEDPMYLDSKVLSKALFGDRKRLAQYQFQDIVRAVNHPHVINLEPELGPITEGLALIKHELMRLEIRENKRKKRTALVVTIPSRLYCWLSEARDYGFSPAEWGKVYVHEGPLRVGGKGYSLLSFIECGGIPSSEAFELIPLDALLVFTTYAVLREDHYKPKGKGFLPRFRTFSTTLLDHAHMIRTESVIDKSGDVQERDEARLKKKGKSKELVHAAFNLTERSHLRYAITSTPYVDKDTDLLTLSKFLDHGPIKGRLSKLKQSTEMFREANLSKWIASDMVVRGKIDVVREGLLNLFPLHTSVSRLLFGKGERETYNLYVQDIAKTLGQDNYDYEIPRVFANMKQLSHLCVTPTLMKKMEKETMEKWFRGKKPVDRSLLRKIVRESVKLRTLVVDLYRLGYLRVERAREDIESDVLSFAFDGAKKMEEKDENELNNKENIINNNDNNNNNNNNNNDNNADAKVGEKRSLNYGAAGSLLHPFTMPTLLKKKKKQNSDNDENVMEKGSLKHTVDHLPMSTRPLRTKKKKKQNKPKKTKKKRKKKKMDRLKGERIVISSETRFVNYLLSLAVQDEGIRKDLGVEDFPVPVVLVYDGSQSLSNHVKDMETFNHFGETEDGKAVFFFTDRTSAAANDVDFDLTKARHIVLTDFGYNPTLISQAIGYLHRVGQTRPVHAHYYTVAGTYEETLLHTFLHDEFARNNCADDKQRDAQVLFNRVKSQSVERSPTREAVVDCMDQFFQREDGNGRNNGRIDLSREYVGHEQGQGGRKEVQCDQDLIHCVLEERNFSKLEDMLCNDEPVKLLDNVVVEAMVEEMDENIEKEQLEKMMEVEGLDIDVYDSQDFFQHLKRQTHPQKAWHILCKGNNMEKICMAENLCPDYRNLMMNLRKMMDGLQKSGQI